MYVSLTLLTLLITPPFSTTPSAPTKTISTLSIMYPTAESNTALHGIPASRRYSTACSLYDTSQYYAYHLIPCMYLPIAVGSSFSHIDLESFMLNIGGMLKDAHHHTRIGMDQNNRVVLNKMGTHFSSTKTSRECLFQDQTSTMQ